MTKARITNMIKESFSRAGLMARQFGPAAAGGIGGAYGGLAAGINPAIGMAAGSLAGYVGGTTWAHNYLNSEKKKQKDSLNKNKNKNLTQQDKRNKKYLDKEAIEQSFLDGFIKAANAMPNHMGGAPNQPAQGMQPSMLPPVGAPNQQQPGQPQQNKPQANQLFLEIMQKYKNMNRRGAPVPPPVPHMFVRPTIV
jgi:hypothetical protein